MGARLYDLHTAVLARLRQPTAFGDAAHDGQVVDPAVDELGRIQPYAVLWLAPGTDPEAPISGPAGTEHRLHVTVAGRDPARCAWAIDRATDVLDGARVVIATGVWADIRWLAGYQPPPIAKDTDENPPRWFCPLIFTATTG